jgi:AGZA family xanthine/uracil permease-like MFS transporter
MRYRWEVALGAVLLAEMIFTRLTVARIRQWMVDALPPGLTHSFEAGIGLLLTFVGLNEAGIVRIRMPGAPVRIGNLASPAVLIAIFSFLAIAVFDPAPGSRGHPGVRQWHSPGPGTWIGIPPNPTPIMFNEDLSAVLNFRFFGVLL